MPFGRSALRRGTEVPAAARPPRRDNRPVLLAFVSVAVLVIVTPGPDTALTIRSTLLGGRAGGVATALGVVTGQAVWTLAASAGLAALLVASEPAFVALKLAGAAYLCYLGARSLLSAARPATTAPAAAVELRGSLLRPAAYRQGLLSNLSNPKMAAFFTSLLPQFAPDGSAFFAMLGLGLLFCTMTFAWLALYATVVARVGDVLRRPRVRRIVDVATGGLLVALGVRLAAADR
jgi:threonine/homoserine/homoserine lactone efflux protein